MKYGEFVRTDKGNIGRIIEKRIGKVKETEELTEVYILDTRLWTIEAYIKKHSKNLIDIIEVRRYY